MKYLLLILAFPFTTLNSFAQLPATGNDVCPLKIGETIPDITLVSSQNIPVNVLSLAKQKPTVLIFYRGGWCPYCTAHLKDLGKAEEDILNAGYQIVAISPDEPGRLDITVDRNELKYNLLSDGDGAFTKQMGVAYKAPDAKWKTNQLQKHSANRNDGFLPVPSIFILNKNAEIVFEYVNPDYKHRMSAELLMAILNNLK